MTNTIGENIKARREELKMTQRDLAAKMGYSNHSTIARAESGKIDLPQSRVAQFAQALGTTPGHLMGWEQSASDAGQAAALMLKDPSTFQMVQDYLTLDEADRSTVCTLVASLAQKKKD